MAASSFCNDLCEIRHTLAQEGEEGIANRWVVFLFGVRRTLRTVDSPGSLEVDYFAIQEIAGKCTRSGLMKLQNLARIRLMSSYSDDPEFHTAPPRLKLGDEGFNLRSGIWR